MNFPLFYEFFFFSLMQHFVAVILLVTMTEEGYILIILNTVNVAYLPLIRHFSL